MFNRDFQKTTITATHRSDKEQGKINEKQGIQYIYIYIRDRHDRDLN